MYVKVNIEIVLSKHNKIRRINVCGIIIHIMPGNISAAHVTKNTRSITSLIKTLGEKGKSPFRIYNFTNIKMKYITINVI